MDHAVGAAELAVGDAAVGPAGHVVGVGVTVVVDVLRALVDGVAEQPTAPVAFFFIEAREIVVLGYAGSSVTVVVVGADEQLQVLATIAQRVVV